MRGRLGFPGYLTVSLCIRNKFDTRDLLATTYGGITIGLTLNLVNRKK